MKKVNGIFIFLATLAIFGIGVESFAKTEWFFSSQTNQPSPSETAEIARLKTIYLDDGGEAAHWTGTGNQGKPTLEEARNLAQIQRRKQRYLARGGSADAWIGTGNQGKPTLEEARKLENDFRLFVIAEIARLKTEYEARGGLESDWKGSAFQGIPNLSEAQALLIAELKKDFLAFGGSAEAWTGSYDNPETTDKVENTPTLSEAQALIAPFEIARLKADFLARGGTENAWTGTYDDPATPDDQPAPTLSEAQNLHSQLVAEIATLKTEYDALGGLESKWTGSYQGTPTLSEAQALVQLLKKSESSHSPTPNNYTLIIGVSGGVGGTLLLCSGLGYWFYRRRQKS